MIDFQPFAPLILLVALIVQTIPVVLGTPIALAIARRVGWFQPPTSPDRAEPPISPGGGRGAGG